MSIEIKSIDCGDFSTDYFSFGTGSKNMIILPGLSVKSVMESAAAIKAQYKIFENDYSVYVLDRRNQLPADYDIEAMARDTALALKVLGLQDNYVFGASQGGMIAMLLAMEHSELVKKLVLGSTTPKVSTGNLKSFKEWISLAGEKDAENLYLSFCGGIYPPDMFKKYKSVFLEFAKAVTDEDLARFAILARASENFDVSDRLGTINCPVLAIGVKGDSVVGEEGAAIIAEKLSPRSDFRLYYYDEKYGHSAFDTAEDYPKRIYDFFKD